MVEGIVLSAGPGTLRRVITRDIVRTIVTSRVPLRARLHWIVIVLCSPNKKGPLKELEEQY